MQGVSIQGVKRDIRLDVIQLRVHGSVSLWGKGCMWALPALLSDYRQQMSGHRHDDRASTCYTRGSPSAANEGRWPGQSYERLAGFLFTLGLGIDFQGCAANIDEHWSLCSQPLRI